MDDVELILTILVFRSSTVIQKLFIEAKKTISFRVIVVDSRPLYEGKRLLCELQSESVDCTYVHMNALSFVMKQVKFSCQHPFRLCRCQKCFLARMLCSRTVWCWQDLERPWWL